MTRTVRSVIAAPQPPVPESAPFDDERAEAFAGRMVGVLDDACVALMASIGHQVGLFDAMASLPPSTTQQVADAVGLHERYVREWLAAMTVARVVEHDPDAATFRLPPEHAACLTRDAGPENMAHVMQFVSLLAQVEGDVTGAFQRGGGVGYEAYPTFHRLMAEDSATVHDSLLLEEIVPLVPGLDQHLTEGVVVADIGCGSGHAINLLAGAYPSSTFVGYDFSSEAIAAARDEALALGLTNATFEQRDVAELALVEAVDLVTAFDAIHDQAHPAVVLSNIARMLRPGGTFLMAETRASSHVHNNHDLPAPVFLYTVSCMHCMTVSMSQGGDGLGAAWGQELAVRMLEDAGLGGCEVRHIEADWFNSYYIATRPHVS